MPMNRAMKLKRTRPASDPVTIADVIMAKAIWNAMSTTDGYAASAGGFASSAWSCRHRGQREQLVETS